MTQQSPLKRNGIKLTWQMAISYNSLINYKMPNPLLSNREPNTYNWKIIYLNCNNEKFPCNLQPNVWEKIAPTKGQRCMGKAATRKWIQHFIIYERIVGDCHLPG